MTLLKFMLDDLIAESATSEWSCPLCEGENTVHLRKPDRKGKVRFGCTDCEEFRGDEHDLLKHHFPDEAFPQRKKRLESYKRRFDLLPKLVVNSAGNSEEFSFRAAKRQAAKPLGTGPRPEVVFKNWLKLNQTLDDFEMERNLSQAISQMRVQVACEALEGEVLRFFEARRDDIRDHLGYVAWVLTC